MKTFPTSFTLETGRLRLRLPSESDIPKVFSATRYQGFNDGMLWDPPEHPNEIAASLKRNLRAWENGEAFGFSIDEKMTAQFVGRISIRPTDQPGRWNIGFWTHPEHQGHGYMTEAVGAVLEFGFSQLEAREIEACHALWNKASERVLQKNGFQFDRYIEQGFQKKGEWVAENLLVIDKAHWMKNIG
ncbi:MAG: GNAT family N-acetyltransferase [Saprospiraceae bacterium]|nr:GNAT family N-acetyltransferase [Lewinella sp.]